MNIINKYKASKEIEKVSSNLYSENLYYIFFLLNSYIPDQYNSTIIEIYNIVFKNYIYENVKNNNSKEECLVCYDTKKFKYKMPCCDKQYVCLNCFEKIYNNNNFNCLYCRKALYKDDITRISKLIDNHYIMKMNNICNYLHKCNFIKEVKYIKKIDDDCFQLKLINKEKITLFHDNNKSIYWHLSNKNFVELMSFTNL